MAADNETLKGTVSTFVVRLARRQLLKRPPGFSSRPLPSPRTRLLKGYGGGGLRLAELFSDVFTLVKLRGLRESTRDGGKGGRVSHMRAVICNPQLRRRRLPRGGQGG